MIVYTASDSFLEIPKGLGNFASNGDGGGQDLGPLSGSVVELQENVENLSGSVQTLTSEVGELSGITEGIGDAVADLLLDVDSIDGRVSGNTDDIAALSAQTIGLSGATVSGLSEANEAANSAYTLADSAYTIASSALTGIPIASSETLGGVKIGSGITIDSGGTISTDENVAYFYYNAQTVLTDFYNSMKSAYDAGKKIVLVGQESYDHTRTVYIPLCKFTSTNVFDFYGEQFDGDKSILCYNPQFKNNGTASNVSSGYITRKTFIRSYTLPTASSSTLGGIKVGSGLTINSDKLSVAIGEGLAYSGNTIVVSGGSEGGDWLWVGKDEYDNWTQAEKEAWYDNILDECWNNDNFKFGIYVVEDKTSSAETGYDQMRVQYKIMTLNSIEAGYNSLHFSGAEFTASNDKGGASIWSARIQRGGGWEIWSNTIESPSNGSSFSFTSGGTTAGYFDVYNFNRCCAGPSEPAGFYSPKNLPIVIVDPDNDYREIGFGSVVASSPMPDGTYSGGSWIFRVNILFSVGADTYRMIGDSVGEEEEGADVRGWHLVSVTQW